MNARTVERCTTGQMRDVDASNQRIGNKQNARAFDRCTTGQMQDFDASTRELGKMNARTFDRCTTGQVRDIDASNQRIGKNWMQEQLTSALLVRCGKLTLLTRLLLDVG